MNKKLQVFVSSTYTDLIEERQAAVEAILDAGHIPAGMELFKAGNESQLKTIYKWIDESDVYMLILGGRYGTVEPKSEKSYTQLEYEYALSKDIPVFAVVLSESFLTTKINLLCLSDVMEQKALDKYQSFKSLVMSKIIRMVDDCKDIKLVIHSTLNEFLNSYDLIGWTRYNNENNSNKLLKDNVFIMKENSLLNRKVQSLSKEITVLKNQLELIENDQYGDYYFTKIIELFKKKKFPFIPDNILIQSVSAFDFFVLNYDNFITGIPLPSPSLILPILNLKKYFLNNMYSYYRNFELIERKVINGKEVLVLTKLGKSFYNLLESENTINN